MMVVDRLLAGRKGFAVLSVCSIFASAAVAAARFQEWVAGLPISGWARSSDTAWQVPAATGIVSLLFHGGALRTGLTDRGFVGLRLSRQSGPYADRRGLAGNKNSIFGDDIGSKAWFAPNPRGRRTYWPVR